MKFAEFMKFAESRCESSTTAESFPDSEKNSASSLASLGADSALPADSVTASRPHLGAGTIAMTSNNSETVADPLLDLDFTVGWRCSRLTLQPMLCVPTR